MWTIVTVCDNDPEQNTTLPFNFAYEEDAKALRSILVEKTCLNHKIVQVDSYMVKGHPGIISRETVGDEIKFINVQTSLGWTKTS